MHSLNKKACYQDYSRFSDNYKNINEYKNAQMSSKWVKQEFFLVSIEK